MIKNSITVANIALKKIGMQTINSFDDNTPSAEVANLLYSTILDLVLEEHEWSFAQTEISLTALDIDPTITERNLDYVYQRPSDCVKINYKTAGAKVSLQGDGIHSDNNALQIIYTRRETNTLIYPASFATALACRLAYEMTFYFTESSAKAKDVLAEYENILLPRAIFNDRTQGNITQFKQGDWETFRNYGAGDDTPNVD